MDGDHQPTDLAVGAGSRLAPKHHVLARRGDEPQCRLDAARDSAAARPHHPALAVIPGIGPGVVGAMPGHHEADASIRVSLLLPFPGDCFRLQAQACQTLARTDLAPGAARSRWCRPAE